jgi:AraC-like DNA-binding protein
MTVRDNSLIFRAKKQPAPNTAGTMLVVELRVFISALARLGYSEDSLLEAAGVQRADLEDPDLQVSCSAYEAIFRCAQRERPRKNLSVLVASETPMGAYPLLDYLVATSDTVADAIPQLIRYLWLVGTPVALRIAEESDRVRVIADSPGNPQAIEYNLTLMVLHLTRETNRQFRATTVNFAHRPDDVAEVERILGCPVRAEAGWNGVELSRRVWKLPLRRGDAVLRGVLERQANEMTSRLSSTGGAIADVRHALASRVAGGDTRIQSVARQLATSPRTLQRRLADEGSSYQELLLATRQEAAAGYLKNSTLAICEIAFLLGYSEPAAFHRAFKRWNGETPQTFRARLRAAKSRSNLHTSLAQSGIR